jgi:glycerate-2-kinase
MEAIVGIVSGGESIVYARGVNYAGFFPEFTLSLRQKRVETTKAFALLWSLQ